MFHGYPWIIHGISMDNPWNINGISIKAFCEVAACLRRFADLKKHLFEKYRPRTCAGIVQCKPLHKKPLQETQTLVCFVNTCFFEVCEAPQACCNLTKSFY